MAERLRCEEPNRAEEAADRNTALLRDRIRADRRAAIAGTAAAVLVALYEGQARFPHVITFWSVLKGSVLMMASPVAAGISAVCFLGLMSRGRTRVDLILLLRRVSIGWLLLPCVSLLYWRGSPYLGPMVILTVLVMVLALRPLFDRPGVQPEECRQWGSLYGLPPADSQPWRSVVIAICAQGMVACAAADRRFWAALLLSCGLFLFVWKWTEVESPLQRRVVGILDVKRVGPAALALTMIPMLLWSGFGARGPLGGRGTPGLGAKVVAPVMAAERRPDFVSVILWPPPPARLKQLIAPVAHGEGGGAIKNPLVIPFDGPYWYFRWPHTDPGPNAHVVKGRKSTDVDVRSTDVLPLEMQARQNVGMPVDLSCCRAIQLALITADPLPVRVGLVLRNRSKPGRPFVMLGAKSIEPATNGTPVKQVLAFAIPEHAVIRNFNEITVIFDRGSQGRRRGAKVAVESFTLEPR